MNKKELKRIYRIKVSFTFIEIAQLKQQAKAVGMNPARYIREEILGKEIIIKRFTPEEKELFRNMASISNNINQIAKFFNQGSKPYNDLFNTRAELKLLIDKLSGNVM